MISRFLLLAAFAAMGQPSFAYDIWFTAAPASVPSGQAYYVEAYGYSWYGSCDINLYKNSSWFASGSGYDQAYAGGSTTDYGAQTVEYFADGYDYASWQYGYNYAWVTITQTNAAPTITWTSAPPSAAVNEWFNIEARGNDSDGNLANVFVWREWSPHAFAGGGNGYEGYSGNGSVGSVAGTITFMAQSRDSNDEYSPVIYHTVNVYVPNITPSVAWVNGPPASVYVNQGFNIQARGHDENGNLSWVGVWKNDAPFAINGGGNGWESHSDNNGATGTAPGVISFKANAGDSSGAEAGFIYHNVAVVNRAPYSPAISASGPGVTWNSANQHYVWWNTDPNPITLTATIHDHDGNLIDHTIYSQHVTGAAPTSTGWSPVGSSTPSNPEHSTQVRNFTPPAITGRWDFHTNGHDGYDSSGGASVTVWVYGMMNESEFVSQSVNTGPLEIGTTRQVSVTFKNTGSKPWTYDANAHGLGSYNPADTLRWNISRVDLGTTETVNPGAERTFTFNILAPLVSGNYDFQWRMLEEGLQWFGALSPNLQIPVVDSVSPTTPTSLQLTDNTHTTVSLSWGASTDASNNVTYRVYRGASVVGTTATLAFTDTGLTPNVAYVYTVRAFDGTNQSAASNAVNVTTDLDPAGDEDGDGMPNKWETDNELDPNSSLDALWDSDHDGWSNIAEYNLGSKPKVYTAGTSALGNGIPGGWPLADANSGLAVGATTGQLAVDKSGSLNYSIPLWTTPGTAGVQPQLSLNYSSGSLGGIAGSGWSIGGISAITRGPQTKIIDGKNKGVTLTDDDRFYLDGQRLVVINGLTYGSHGAEYRTELDSITKIVSYTASGTTGPAWFKVWTKAGLIIEFGNTQDSAFDAWGKSVKHSWHVNRISDTKGNYMDFVYEEDAENGVHRIDRINYTGNISSGSPNIAPYASVRFEYEERSDPSFGYVAGSPVSNLQRLKYVRSYYGEAVARTYTLAYEPAPRSNRSMLASLTEAGTDGKAYPPLTFDYEANDEGWDDGSAFVPHYFLADNSNFERPAGSGFIDFDGDGRTDFVARRDNNGNLLVNMAYRNTGTGWESDADYLLPYKMAEYENADDQGSRFVDLNGDGLVDYICRKLDYNEAWLNTPTSLGSKWVASPNWRVPALIYYDGTINDHPLRGGKFIDINADGRPDFVAHLTATGGLESLAVYLNNGNGWDGKHTNYSSLPGFSASNLPKYKPRFIDLNGDGLPDIVARYQYGGDSLNMAWLNNGNGWTQSSAYQLPKTIANDTQPGPGAEFADVNGDGLPDLVWYRELTNTTFERGAALNTGAGWVQNTDIFNRYAPHAPLSRDGIYVNGGSALLDINADGVVDLLSSRHFSGFSQQKDVFYGNLNGWSWAGDNAPHELPHLLLQENLKQTGVEFVDFNGDGAVDVVWYRQHSNGTSFSIAGINRSKPTNGRLNKVTNGLGVIVDVTYASIMDPNVYTRAADNSDLPSPHQPKVVNLIGPMYVVRSVVNDNGVGSTHSIVYSYAKLRSHLERGSLGFGSMKIHDTTRDIRTQVTYRQDYPFIGQASYSKVTRGSDAGPLLSETTTAWAEKSGTPANVSLIYASSVVEKTYDYNTQVNYLTTTTTTAMPDAYGNVSSISVSTSDGFGKSTTNTYEPADTDNWILGRLSTSSVTATAPDGEPNITRTSSFEYYDDSGLLESETVQPSSDILRLKTTYTYDRFGNKDSIEIRGKSLTVDENGDYMAGSTDTSRTTTTQYDAKGRFPDHTTNAALDSEDYGYDQVLGVMTSLVGANDLPTSWTYDGFGRKEKEFRSDGTQSVTHYRWTPAGSLAGSKYFVESESTGSSPTRTHYDKFGRSRWSQSIDGTGKMVLQQTQYDGLGRVSQTSVPYFNDASPIYWSGTSAYDGLDRPLTTFTPDDENGDQNVNYSYSGFTATVTDPKLRVSETTKNSQGWTTSNIRNKGAGPTAMDYSAVSYAYDALGNLKKTTAAGIETTLSYDLRGRKESMVDADMGTWHYRYNVFGDLIWQKDANPDNPPVVLSYDNLGRLIQRVDKEGTTTWVYDTSPTKGRGKLHSVTVSPASDPSQVEYSEVHLYDDKGRPVKVTRTIDGLPYAFETAYDGAGRPNRLKYPSTGLTGSPFSTRNVYNQYGFLKEIRHWLDADTDNSSDPINIDKTIAQPAGKVYWMADSYHISGRVNGETAGNGVASDRGYSKATGRLLSANIDRATVTAPVYQIQQLNYYYDAVGNVKRRYDAATTVNRDEYFYITDPEDGYDGLDRLKVHRIGDSTVTVTYDQKGNIKSKSGVGVYDYSGVNAGPHAVTTAGVHTYEYDVNGNMLSGADRTLEWTSFNQVKKITDAANRSSSFFFGAAHERVRQVRTIGSSTTIDTTIYVGSAYEKITTDSTGLVEHKHYIMAPTGRVAVFTDRSNMMMDTRYFHTDGLGSITVVTDEKGNVLKRYAYEAWGKQITLYTNTAAGITNQAATTRGFTDHEMLADFGLIHMNGRVYDPVLGRFLSADPHIDGISDAQGYNRYSYVGNNPMNATDPSGYFKLKDILPAIIAVVVTVVTYGAASAWATGYLYANTTMFMSTAITAGSVAGGAIAGAAAGFASGFAGSLLNGGSIGDAFKAGAVGGLVGSVGGAAAAGIGAYFGHATGSLANEIGRGIAHGASGGLIEEVTGGEFRHGFFAGLVGSASGSITGSNSLASDSWGGIAGRTIVAAAAGGTASAIAGGSFTNGAETAAFLHLLNAEGTNLSKKAGETSATIEGKLAHAGFGKGVKVADGVITDALIETPSGVEVRELKPLTRLANKSKYNAAEIQLMTQMDAVATARPGTNVSGSLFAWTKNAGKFHYTRLLKIKLSVLNVFGFIPGMLNDYDTWRRSQQNGTSFGAQLKQDTHRYPYIETPFGRIPNPYWDGEI